MVARISPPRTILIVEDDVDLRGMFRTALAFAGYRVIEAGNGMTALRLLDTEPPPALVVLDLGLPIVSGRVVRDELLGQAHLRHVPVIVVTGLPGDHADLQASCVLHKPVDPDHLVRTVRSCLTSGETSAT